MFPFSRETSSYEFKHTLRIHAEEDVHQDDKGGEVVAFPEAILQVIYHYSPLFILIETLYIYTTYLYIFYPLTACTIRVCNIRVGYNKY